MDITRPEQVESDLNNLITKRHDPRVSEEGEMTKEEYERSVGALRENMREALVSKRKYVVGEEGVEENRPEGSAEDSER